MVDLNDYEKVRNEIWRRNRISFGRMFMHQGEPYSLRKYKMIFKREMEENAHLYDVLDSEGNPKEEIDGIIGNDERLWHNSLKQTYTMPEDYEE